MSVSTEYLKVVTNKGVEIERLRKKRREGFLRAIKRANPTEKILANDRICSRHFISGEPADLLDERNPDWLPTLHLGHDGELSEVQARAAEKRMGQDKRVFDSRTLHKLKLRCSQWDEYTNT